MSAPILEAMPETFPAGTDVTYSKTLSDYAPADGWALKLYLAGASTVAATTATNSSGAWLVSLLAATTAAAIAGVYQWAEVATKGTQVVPVASGTVMITPNIMTATAGTMQAWCEKTLALVEASIAGNTTDDVQGYTIQGRSLSRYSLIEKVRLRSLLKSELASLKRGGKFSTTVNFMFTGTGMDS